VRLARPVQLAKLVQLESLVKLARPVQLVKLESLV
jgi:hypothetical protein